MARLVVSAAVGVAVGLSPLGPQAGFAAFSATYGLTGFLDPAQQSKGPRLDDLKGTTASYGTPISQTYGHPRVAGAVVWCSDKHTIENTESAGGKGGPSTDVTTYTYTIDARFLLTANVIGGVRRIWSNGKLIWSAADDADAETVAASAETDAWERMTVYTGAADQMPDPVEEAALGIDNCPAYRGRGSVFVEGLNLGGSGYLPNLTFEVTPDTGAPTGDVLLLVNFNGEEGSTTFTDGSSYSHPMTSSAYEQSSDAAAYGSDTGGMNTATTAEGACIRTADPSPVCTWSTDQNLCIEARAKLTGDPNLTVRWGTMTFSGNSDPTGIIRDDGVSPDIKRFGFEIAGQQFLGAEFGEGAGLPEGAVHLELNYYGATTKTGILYVNGAEYLRGTYTGETVSGLIETLQAVEVAGGTLAAGVVGVDGVRITKNRIRHTDDFTPPTSEPTDDSGNSFEASDEALEDVLADLATGAGIAEGYLDFSSCEGQVVRALAVSQVTPRRQVMEMLGGAYLQEFVEGAGLKTVARGGSSVATIAYDEMGASSGDPVEPLPLKRLNDIEIPRQFAITYANILNDYQNGTEYSDRLLGGSTSVATTELPLGLRPQEAKRIADCRLLDAAAGIIQIGPVGLTRAYARLEPTDVVTLTDHEGSTFRARVLKITDDGGLRTLELVQDDASAVNSSAVTDEGYESSTVVRSVTGTLLELMDIPILRDADNDPGLYAAVTKASTNGIWSGSALFKGINDTGWSEVTRYTDRTFIGTTTTELAAWTGGDVFDEVGSVTVSGVGTLQSYTRDAIINGTANGCLIGSEVLYARTATAVSEGVYTLTGLLRGRRGTEWAAADGAEIGSRVVLLQSQGIRRVLFQTGELGSEYDFRAVTLGQSIGSASSESITPQGVGLKPLAPVDLRTSRDGSGGFAITWARRSRLSAQVFGTVPLGETSEAYEVDILDGADVVRTLSVTSAHAQYNAAQQVADFGSVQSSIDVAVYQMSSIVGRGYALTGTLSTSYTPTTQSNTITLGGTFAAGVPISVYANGLLIGSRTSISGDTNLAGVATALAAVVNAHASYSASAVGSVITVTGNPGAVYTLTAVVGGSSAISSVITQEAALASDGSSYLAECYVSELATGQTEPVPAGTSFSITVKQNGITRRTASFTTTAESTRADVIHGLVDAFQDDSYFADHGIYFSAASSEVGGIYGLFSGPVGDPSWGAFGGGSAPFTISVSIQNPGSEPVAEDQPQVVQVTVTGTPANGEVFRVTLDGTPCDYTATVPTDTREEVIDGLVAAIDADADLTAAQISSTKLEASATFIGEFSYSTSITRGITATVA